jgi:peroxiredoxin
MRRFALVALAMAALGTAAVAGESAKDGKSAAAAPETKAAITALALGASAPMTDVKMRNVDGKDVTIAAMKGEKGTLVVFTCNHCPWAQRWESRIVELGNSYAKQGIGVIAISSNDPAAFPDDDLVPMQKRAKEKGYGFPYVMDATSDVARAFGATRTPEIFLFDATGKLVYKGAVDDNAREPEKVTARYLKDALDAVVAGKKIELAETKAFGCTIKYREKKAATSSAS